jgi:NADH dehydrogenase
MILVAGGTGFIGAAIVRELMRQRLAPVAVLSRIPSKVARRFPEFTLEARGGDVTDPDSLPGALQGIETVINCVQFPTSPIEIPRKGWTFEKVDYLGTVNLVEASKKAGVKRIIYLSGVGAAPDAERHWFRFKWQAEEAVRKSGIPYTILRPTWVYGPEDVALNRFLSFAKVLPFVPTFGNGKQLMQPVFVEDVARAVVLCLRTPAAVNQTFEIGGPEVMTMDDVIRTALEVAGKRRLILHQPVVLGKILGRVASFLPNPPLTADAVDFITYSAVADNGPLLSALGLRLTPLREGLATYLRPR